jgi:hypothetical protein
MYYTNKHNYECLPALPLSGQGWLGYKLSRVNHFASGHPQKTVFFEGQFSVLSMAVKCEPYT